MDMARQVSDEERFLGYACGGDARALEELLRAHADSAYTQARRMLGNAADADDAVQEAFLQLARSAWRYDPAIPFRAWLGRLVHIAALRVRRADRRRERREREAANRRAGAMDGDVDHELVRRAVAELPESYRAPIDLHYFAGLSQGECARALGLSENAVAVRIHRGRERLRQALGGAQPIATGVVVAALGGAPAHAAPAAIAAHAAAIAGWAANGALPATTVKLSLIQQGTWLMSQHPIVAGAIAATLTAAAIAAPLAHAADGARQDPPPVPHARAPAAKVAADDAQRVYWTGRAGALLPFVDPQATIRFGVDFDALKADGVSAPPTSMLADPRLAKTIAHIRHVLELWTKTGADTPPLLGWFDSAHGIALSFKGDPSAKTDAGLMIADLGAAAPAMREYADARIATPRGQGDGKYADGRVGPFIGWRSTRQMLGFDGERIVFGIESSIKRAVDRPSAPEARWRSAPLWLEFQAADLPDYARLASRLGTAWASAKPLLTIAVTPGRDGWRGTSSISNGLRPRLGTIGPVGAGALASAKLAGAAVAFASGDDLGAAIAIAAPSDALASLAPITGTFLTGEMAVCADPGAPLPLLSVVAALKPDADHAELAKVLDPVLQMFGGTRPDAVKPEWTLLSPIGPVTVLIANDRLVITTAPDPKPLLARGAAMPLSIAARADLAALGRSYLPLLYAQVPAEPRLLDGQDFPTAIRELAMLRDNFVIQIVQDGATSLGALVLGPDSPFSGQLDRDLRRVFGAATDAATVDASFALYTDWSKAGDFTAAQRLLLYRLDDGWHEARFDGWNRQRSALTLEQARKLTVGLRLVSGQPLDAMRPIAVPELATFDRRWLPDLAAVCDHLPRWTLGARCAADGIVVEEDGVPMLAFAGMMVPVWAPMRRIEVVERAVPAPEPAPAPKTRDF